VEEKMEPSVRDVWVIADAIVSPLGFSTADNFRNVVSSNTGLIPVADAGLLSSHAYVGRVAVLPETDQELTRFEQMAVACVQQLFSKRSFSRERTLFILSTTKGNIDLLRTEPAHTRIHLHAAARHIAEQCGLPNVVVVSNACVSGVMAMTIATRYLQHGKYDHAIVLGADELTPFVLSGFQSLGALSDEPCKPFDSERKGINLGEAAAAVFLTTAPHLSEGRQAIKILGSGLSNDANHISGPSRTGEELAAAIEQALRESNVEKREIDFICAHGTATMYNDEMEAKAFAIAGLSDTPLNSLKGFYGHTLGAAGVLETVISIQSLLNDQLVPSLGFKELGVSKPLNVITKAERTKLRTFLKTASGFGGCNAAIVLQKQ
jgi:3-oxoacyl-[acyl-carrier-protein] synthase I